jgi:hypothetical protein
MGEADEWGDDEETLGEMAERYGRRAVVAEAENARLRAELAELKKVVRGYIDMVTQYRNSVDAFLSNEGGDDG